ncbi:MAG TPA: glycoside hydrolase family 5 protein [Flavobacteriaceae bacterium]|nr:glycoside hydrolase family 5 protein [Flavobacteriaceae bacterium]
MKYLNVSILFICLAVQFVMAQTTPHQMVQNMGRGINLGNVLSAPIEGNWAPAVEETFFEDVANVGFTTVRIPIRFDMQTTPLSSVNYTDGSGSYIGSINDYTVNTSYLDRIEEVTDWALNQGLVAIIDVHGDHWFWESYDTTSTEYKTGADRLAAEDRFRAIWRDISNRFQNKSDNLLFEIMNEAYFSMSASEVDYINAEILSIIRQNNPTRNVIVNGGGLNSWEAPLQMSTSFLNSDNYLIATFHYYKPFNFTSSSKQQFTNFDWGTAQDKATVDSNFDSVLTWSQTNNIPVFLGEFGADNEGGFNYETETYGAYGGPDNASRVEYHRYLAEAAITRGFSFTAWCAGHKSNKTIYNVSDRSWVVDVRNALLGVDCIDEQIIKNADVECGFDSDWDLFVQSPAVANNTNADTANSRGNSNTMEVNVTTNSGSFNGVILRNTETTDVASLAGQTLNFSCYAKAETASQQFRFRIKAVVSDSNVLSASTNMNLSNTDFQLHEFQYTVPQNVTSLQFQVLCGKQLGKYYFDDF